jgi:hypothetical protein
LGKIRMKGGNEIGKKKSWKKKEKKIIIKK